MLMHFHCFVMKIIEFTHHICKPVLLQVDFLVEILTYKIFQFEQMMED